MKRNLSIILFITFFEYLSLSVFFGTLMPAVLAQQSIFHLALSEHERSVLYGLILLILPIGQFLITPLWGQLSDQYGRKAILMFTLVGSALGYFLMGMAMMSHILVLFILGRVVTACFAANVAISQASLADISVGKQKTKRFNLQFIFVSLGFIVGPYLIVVTTRNINYANVYWALAAGYCVGFLLVMLAFHETLQQLGQKAVRWLLNVERIFAIFKSGRLKQLFIIWMVFQIGWSLFFQYSGEFLYLQRHLSNDFINHLFSWVGVGIVLVQICLAQPLSHKVAPQKVVPWAVLLMGAGLLVAGFLPINIGFYAMLGIYCVGIALFLPNMNAYVSNEAAADQQGSTMAMMTSSQSLMDIVVTLLGSFFVSYYLPAPYVVGGAIILISLLLWMMWHKQKN